MSGLAARLEELAQDLEEVERRPIGDDLEYRRAGVPFAATRGRAVAFRLRPDVVRAVLATPSTAPSARGGEWIELDPPEVDRFALDRAEAWFQSAWRLAGEARGLRH